MAQKECNIAISYRKSIEDVEDTEEIAMQKACGDIDNCDVKSFPVQTNIFNSYLLFDAKDSWIEIIGKRFL